MGSSIGVWNLDTLEYANLPVRTGTAYVSDRIALSPDHHYLVIAWHMIRVWDLTNLPEDFDDRDPTYNYHGPAARIQSVRFIDNVTIETTSAEGVQRWNVETGELVSETP